MTPNRVRAVQQRRQSNAAGPHGRRPPRAAERAEALADWDDELDTEDGFPELRFDADPPSSSPAAPSSDAA